MFSLLYALVHLFQVCSTMSCQQTKTFLTKWRGQKICPRNAVLRELVNPNCRPFHFCQFFRSNLPHRGSWRFELSPEALSTCRVPMVWHGRLEAPDSERGCSLQSLVPQEHRRRRRVLAANDGKPRRSLRYSKPGKCFVKAVVGSGSTKTALQSGSSF